MKWFVGFLFLTSFKIALAKEATIELSYRSVVCYKSTDYRPIDDHMICRDYVGGDRGLLGSIGAEKPVQTFTFEGSTGTKNTLTIEKKASVNGKPNYKVSEQDQSGLGEKNFFEIDDLNYAQGIIVVDIFPDGGIGAIEYEMWTDDEQ